MPVYEYQCESCQHHFELRQKFSDPPPECCPECGQGVKKLISSASFALKGGGWYTEGYGTKPAASQSPAPCAGGGGGGCAGCPAAAA
jgi:putative FmdB family regulatory protein